MLLLPSDRLAEVPGFSREQLDDLARSVELRRQQLESDIKAYIKRKQDALRDYEDELIKQQRSMERVENIGSAETAPTENAEATAGTPASPDHSVRSSPHPRERAPEEKAKRTKHTRVHKREKELYGLVTPVFLPLLDARDTSPTKKKEKKQPRPERTENADTLALTEQPAPSRDAEKSKENRKSRREHKDMEGVVPGEPETETSQANTGKKSKRSAVKKSSLRHKDTPRQRRKRVSLVIDGQTVLPADTVLEPALISPSSETTSASNSTTSLDDMIDPRLTRLPSSTHVDAVHHSLPVPMSITIHSPTKPLIETPTSSVIESSHPLPLPSPRSTIFSFVPPQSATRTFLDPSPTHPSSIPEDTDPNDHSYLSSDQVALDALADPEENWGTYVGGLHGSGADDVDQAGSYGYPSSLGASYLESYMQNRPLSVRMQAASKAGLNDREKRDMLADKSKEADDEVFGVPISRAKDADADDDMDVIGSMEDF